MDGIYDIGIIGAGPAGATLARLLAGRFRILLLNRGRCKCCGGILAPEAQKMLARLDLALPRAVLADPQPFAVAVLDAGSNLVRHYSRQYVNIDRDAFDRWLLSLVPSNVDLRSGAVYKRSDPVADPHEPRTIHFTEQGEMRSEKVRWLIGADGAASKIRREFFSDPASLKRYIAVQEWFALESVGLASNGTKAALDPWNDYVGVFDAELTDFYAWTIPKDRHLIVGGAFPVGSNSRSLLDQLKRKLECFGLRLGNASRREAGQLLRPLSTSSIQAGEGRVALVGEAAGLISPSSAEGISAALSSADSMADAFGASDLDFAKYRKNINGLLWSVWRKNIKSPLMFNPWLRRQVMLSGLTALEK